MNEQARRSSPPNRIRSPTDQQFASGCSPPCLAATQLPSATELWHTPTRTFTVLMWRPHGRTHAGMDSRHPGPPDASGDIHVVLDSSTPCWNDVIEGFYLT